MKHSLKNTCTYCILIFSFITSEFFLEISYSCYIYIDTEVAQSCPTLCDPVDSTLPDSSVHGIFQARVLEWVAFSFSNTYSLFLKLVKGRVKHSSWLVSRNLDRITNRPSWWKKGGGVIYSFHLWVALPKYITDCN